VASIYSEKLDENYYPLLEKFLTEEPSIYLLLKSEANAIRKSQDLKDKIRAKFKVKKFEISEKDLELLRDGRHPRQKEITKEMALENLIHVANNFEEICENIRKIFSEVEIEELRGREPQLYQLFLEYYRELEKHKEIMIK